MKFFVDYFGCRSNQAEVQEWIVKLENAGYELTTRLEEAGFAILNTCSVTDRAEKDVLRYIARSYRHSTTPWLIAGCTVASARDELARRYAGYFFFDNHEKTGLVEAVRRLFPLESNIIHHSSFKSRVFLKVQDGCNFRCAFCIVPRLRGPARSLPEADILRKARHFASLGYREVVLTGINLSAYGYDLFPRRSLLELTSEVCRIRDLAIVRLSSLDPRFVRYQFVKELHALGKIADSFHFSLQSGCDSVLERMKRGGHTADFRRVLGHFRKFFPDANLGSDMIVGFPGETEKEFHETLDFAATSGLNYIHIFPFSPRPGTRAALMEPVPVEIVRRRAKEFKELNHLLRMEYRERFRDRVLEGVLIEEKPDYAMVITRNFLSVRIPPLAGYRKKKLRVRIQRILNENICEGQVAQK
jgi:threonylcarbamoyladenosine tRNA methylthiotransferase MtaB